MEDIKIAVKKAKKEEKQNPEYLYQLGLRFKNGDEAKADMFKAAKYFEKAGKLGHAEAHKEHALFWWKTVKEYYFSEIYFKKAIEAGSEEAKTLLEEMKQEQEQKAAEKAAKKTASAKSGASDLCDVPAPADDMLTSFLKMHTLVRCPSCKGKILTTDRKSEGEMTEQYIEIYDKGTSAERRYGPYTRPTYGGVTETTSLKCESCALSFTKVVRRRLEAREAEPTWKEVFTENNRTDWWLLVELSYEADKTVTPKDVLKILKKSECKYEGKYQ